MPGWLRVVTDRVCGLWTEPMASMSRPAMIRPLSQPPDAVVALPGSKSITNRALVTAALASGTTTLDGVAAADDIGAMIAALRALGIVIDANQSSRRVTVRGSGGTVSAAGARIDAHQSGTTGRFVLPVAALGSQPVLIDGHQQLRNRPMDDQICALRSLGVTINELGLPGRLPLRVTGPVRGSSVSIPGLVSSQFCSGLMLAGAVVGLVVQVVSADVSRPYLDMTAEVMRAFGADVNRTRAADSVAWSVGGGYVSPGLYEIEPDATAASYFLGAAAITGGRVRIEGLGRDSLQGDVAFAEVLARMGANVEVGVRHIEIRGPRQLKGIDVDLSQMSDTAPTLAAVAAFADGPTTVRGIGFIRNKESDRVAGPVTELRRCGIDAEVLSDGFVVRPKGPPLPAMFETYDDHRMAMAFALIGLVVNGVGITDPRCVSKTFPDFFVALDQLR